MPPPSDPEDVEEPDLDEGDDAILDAVWDRLRERAEALAAIKRYLGIK